MINVCVHFMRYRSLRLILTLVALIVTIDWAGCQRTETIAQHSQRTGTPAIKTIKSTIRNGRLLYFSGRSGAPRLISIPSFLDMYTDEELASVTELNLAENNISRIEGLKRLPNLKILDLGSNKIKSISGLDVVPGLEILNLSQNQITKIDGMDGAKNLKELYLTHNLIERIENLSSLTNLEVLDLEWNKIREIQDLGGLKSLKWLLVGGNRLEDYSGLLELDQVKDLSLASPNNVITDEAKKVFEEWNRRHPDEQIKF